MILRFLFLIFLIPFFSFAGGETPIKKRKFDVYKTPERQKEIRNLCSGLTPELYNYTLEDKHNTKPCQEDFIFNSFNDIKAITNELDEERYSLDDLLEEKKDEELTNFTPVRTRKIYECIKRAKKSPEARTKIYKVAPLIKKASEQEDAYENLSDLDKEFICAVQERNKEMSSPIPGNDLGLPICNSSHIFRAKEEGNKVSGYHYHNQDRKIILNILDKNKVSNVFAAYCTLPSMKSKLSTFFPNNMTQRQVIIAIKYSVNEGKLFERELETAGYKKTLGKKDNIYIESIIKDDYLVNTAYPILYYLKLNSSAEVVKDQILPHNYNNEFIQQALTKANKYNVIYKTRYKLIVDIAQYLPFYKKNNIDKGIYMELPSQILKKFKNLRKS